MLRETTNPNGLDQHGSRLPLREIANLALWFVPEGAQSAWTLQETHRNSTSYARDEARTSERLLDRQTS